MSKRRACTTSRASCSASLSPDGAKIYVGTVESGLWVANTSDMVFSQKNADVHVKCLATRNSELWACGDATSGFIVGESLDDGATFAPKMRYVSSLCGPVECSADSGTTLGCGADSNAASCADAYQTFCSNDVTHSCGSCTASAASGADAGKPGTPAPDGGIAATGDAGPLGDGGTRSVTPSNTSRMFDRRKPRRHRAGRGGPRPGRDGPYATTRFATLEQPSFAWNRRNDGCSTLAS